MRNWSSAAGLGLLLGCRQRPGTGRSDPHRRLSNSDLGTVLATADVCVNPDEANRMNDISTMNKIMEYMALAKPIVQFDLHEGRVSAGNASLYAMRNNAVSLGKCIVELIDDPEERTRMGQLGARRLRSSLSWESQIRGCSLPTSGPRPSAGLTVYDQAPRLGAQAGLGVIQRDQNRPPNDVAAERISPQFTTTPMLICSEHWLETRLRHCETGTDQTSLSPRVSFACAILGSVAWKLLHRTEARLAPPAPGHQNTTGLSCPLSKMRARNAGHYCLAGTAYE